MSDLNKTAYYAVIFTSTRTDHDEKGYADMAVKMAELAKTQFGFLGIESARNDIGITVSYWKDMKSINRWKSNIDHKLAQELGKQKWYKSYKVRIAKIEYEYDFDTSSS